MAFSTYFLQASQSGVIKVTIPVNEGDKSIPQRITGILQEDPQIKFGNNWSPISELANGLDPLQELQQVIQTESISSYVSASGNAWKGTPPIAIEVSFYLISFNKYSHITKQARLLASLCALNTTGATKSRVHGGYQYSVFENNETLSNLGDIEKAKNITYHDLRDITRDDGEVSGTVSITINSRSHTSIKGLLVKALQLQPSTVCVRSGEPLYYLVNMSLIGYRAPILTDIEHMFGVG